MPDSLRCINKVWLPSGALLSVKSDLQTLKARKEIAMNLTMIMITTRITSFTSVTNLGSSVYLGDIYTFLDCLLYANQRKK